MFEQDLDAVLNEKWDWDYARRSRGPADYQIKRSYPARHDATDQWDSNLEPNINGFPAGVWNNMTPEQQKEIEAKLDKQQQTLDQLDQGWFDNLPPAPPPAPKPKEDPKVADIPTGSKAIIGNYYVDQWGQPLAGAIPKKIEDPEPKPEAPVFVYGVPEAEWDAMSPEQKQATREKAVAEREAAKATKKPKIPTSDVNDNVEVGRTDTGEMSRVVRVDPNNLQPGFVIFHDQHPNVPLDGPYSNETEARGEMMKVAQKLAQDEIDGFEAEGQELNDVQREQIKQHVLDNVSFRWYDPKKEATPEVKEKGRRYEYGQMRETQLQMLKDGKVQFVKDENENPEYIKNPTLDNLKKVWCPLLLDTLNPPRQPWTFEQIAQAMMPVVNHQVSKYAGGGFTQSEALGVALEALMKAVLNDKGMSPFVPYARKWIWSALYRAKKTQGIIRRPTREAGWVNQGLSSTDAPLIGAEGNPDGSVSDTIGTDTPSFAKMTCPDCGGTKFDPEDPGAECRYCKGTGKTAPTKKFPNGKKCGLCKGTGKIRRSCNSCKGTGTIVMTSKKEWQPHGGLDITKDEQGNYQVSGNIDPSEKAELIERLNKAGRLIKRMMDAAQLTPDQQDIINMRFGLGQGTYKGPPMGTTEIAAWWQKTRGRGTKQLIDTALERILTKMRKVITNASDEDMYDWFLEFQKDYGLADLKDIEDEAGYPIKGWAEKPDDDKLPDKAAFENPQSPWFIRNNPELTNKYGLKPEEPKKPKEKKPVKYAWQPRTEVKECLDLMMAVHHQMILEEIESGKAGLEVLEAIG